MKSAIRLYLITFIILSLLMHYKDFLNSPIAHIKNLYSAGAYGFGSLHPLIFTFFVFIVLFLLKAVLSFFKRN